MSVENPATTLYRESNGQALLEQENPGVMQLARAQVTPFGHVRVAAPYTLGDMVHLYGLIDSYEYSTSTSGGGSVTAVAQSAGISLTVPASNGAYAKLRTNTYFRYQAGKAQVWRITCFHTDTGKTNQIRRWGYLDDNNGMYFRLNGTTLQIVRRSDTSGSVVEATVVNQANWNQDTMDGNGRSGVVLDVTKGNIYEAHFQWLGVGQIWWFVNGILVHISDHPNTIAGPYIRSAQLPLSFEVENVGASSGTSGFTYICASVSSEGGAEPPYQMFGAYNSADKTVTTTESGLLSIQVASTFNSITNRTLVVPVHLNVSTEGTRAGWRLVLNPTITGASYSSVDADSGVQYNTAFTSISGGRTIMRGFLPNTNDRSEVDISHIFSTHRGLRRNAPNTSSDVLAVFGVNEAGSTTNMRASLTWKEIR